MKKSEQVKTKARKAWAMVDPETGFIEVSRIYDRRERNGGRGSITEGWKMVRVEIRPIK